MDRPRRSPAKALAIALGLAIALVPAASGLGASKKPAKAGTVKGCSLKKKAKCKKVKITKAKVGKVSLAGADLSGATITGATFTGTDLTGANLAGAKISNTTFTDVKVGNLVLDGATLGGVKFIRVRGGAQAASELPRGRQRAQDCTATTAPDMAVLADPDSEVFTCTGGGVSMRNAIVSSSVSFSLSTIPGSDFSGMSHPDSIWGGKTIISLLGTNASRSNFAARGVRIPAPLQFSDAQKPAAGGWVKSNIEGSILDGANIWLMYRTDAVNTSLLGVGWTTRPQPNDEVNLTGARGLSGATTVAVSAASGATAPRGLKTLQIREDGYFRPGVVCTTLPCSTSAVAIGAPVSIIANATEPVGLAVPGWTCKDAEAVAGGYRSVCTIQSVQAAGGTGTASSPAAATITVRSMLWGGVGTTPANIWIDQLNSGGGVASTTTCAAATTCSATAPQGTGVQVRMQQSWAVAGPSGWFDLWCPGTTAGDMGTARMSSQVSSGPGVNDITTGATCPAHTLNADTTVTSWAS